MKTVVRRLTRVPRWDPRNLEHQIEAADPITLPMSKYHRRMTFLDQGSTPACTGFSEVTALSFPPKSLHEGTALTHFASQAYRWAQRDDEWPGEDYEGSSVLGAARGLMRYGFVVKYEWMLTIDALLTGLVRGPVVVGIPWKQDMFTPDSQGILHCTGPVAGGHAICTGAFKKYGQWIRLDNTWGRAWGIRGSAWINKVDLNELLVEGGSEALQLTRSAPMPPFDVLPN